MSEEKKLNPVVLEELRETFKGMNDHEIQGKMEALLVDIVLDKFREGKSEQDIAQYIVDNYGGNLNKALEMVTSLLNYYKKTRPGKFNATIIEGILLIVVGFGTTIWSFVTAYSGGTVYIMYGMILAGVLLIVFGTIKH
jgi:hypothetical protein